MRVDVRSNKRCWRRAFGRPHRRALGTWSRATREFDRGAAGRALTPIGSPGAGAYFHEGRAGNGRRSRELPRAMMPAQTGVPFDFGRSRRRWHARRQFRRRRHGPASGPSVPRRPNTSIGSKLPSSMIDRLRAAEGGRLRAMRRSRNGRIAYSWTWPRATPPRRRRAGSAEVDATSISEG